MSESLLAQLREAALAGALPQAARGLEDLDRRWPHPEVAALRAWVALVQGDDDGAARWLATTFARAPGHREALTLAMELARRQGRIDDALAHAQALVALAPRDALAQFNLGALLQARGAEPEARAAYDAALAADPGFAPALRARGWQRFDAGDAAAGADFAALAAVAPRDPAAPLGLGACALRAGDAAAALVAFERAAVLAPHDPLPGHGLADALERLGRTAESLAARRAVLARSGGDPGARCQLAMALSRAGEAEAACDQAAIAAREGGGALARWLGFQLLPIVYRDTAELGRWREHWRQGLAAFDAATPRIAAAEAATVLSALPSFYRHYLDDDLLADQRAAGAVVGRLARSALRMPRARGAARASGRLRVGFASAHFDRHTVGRLFGGLLRALDRARFEVLAIHLGPAGAGREAALALADAAIGPLHALPAWVDALEAAQLDALVWLDIGMDGTTQALSALRFAPWQAMLWGHPVTSGLPSIDCFIGAQGMAPAEPAAHYSERFAALPGIGLSVPRPPVPAASPPPGAVRLLCAQGIHKLLPVHDAVFATILAQVPEASLDLLPGAAEPLRARLARRLRESCVAMGVDFERRVRVHPLLPDAAFRERLAQADLVLDSFGWSGGWTSLQALAAGLPVLTCPGAGLRTRHTRAFLARLGLETELAVPDEAAYIARAVALATDAAARARLAGCVVERSALLFDDPAPARALSDLVWAACGR